MICIALSENGRSRRSMAILVAVVTLSWCFCLIASPYAAAKMPCSRLALVCSLFRPGRRSLARLFARAILSCMLKASPLSTSWSVAIWFMISSPLAIVSSKAKGDNLLPTLLCHSDRFVWKWITSTLFARNEKSLAGMDFLKKSSGGSPKLIRPWS